MSNETTFSEDEKRVLASVLDEIIPPRGDGKLPGAGQLGVGSYIDEALQSTPEMRAMIVQGLADLDHAARNRSATSFGALPTADKLQLLSQQAFVLPLTFHAYVGYYQHARVIEALGIEARPPHPKGYGMEPIDLTLLDPVRRRPKLYRDC